MWPVTYEMLNQPIHGMLDTSQTFSFTTEVNMSSNHRNINQITNIFWLTAMITEVTLINSLNPPNLEIGSHLK